MTASSLCKIVLFAAALVLLGPAAGRGADRIRKIQGSATGVVEQIGPQEVKIRRAGELESVPVNEIEWVEFDGEPAPLGPARVAIRAGRYAEALDALAVIKPEEIKRNEVRQDLDFYRALAAARLALAGGDKVVEAGTLMARFVQANASSYHYLAALETLGDLYLAVNQFDKAVGYYQQVAQAPWIDYRMRAGVAIGRASLAQGKADEALKSFEAVLSAGGVGAAADRQRLEATLGKARALAAGGQLDESVKLLNQVIAKAGPDDAEPLAKAYNALGGVYRKAGKPKDAVIAYLHVDILYANSRRDHIEALENLAALWTELAKPERAADATRILRERYKVALPTG